MKTARNPLFIGVVCVATVLALWSTLLAEGRVAELQVYRRDGLVCLDLRAVGLLDERTSLTIDSGLPGTCVFCLLLEDRDHRIVTEHFLEMSMRLDLWENRYLLEGHGGDREFTSLVAADSAWSRLQGLELCSLDRLDADREYRLLVQIVVQPLTAKDRERMSRYVSRHSGSSGEELSLNLGALFAGLLGQGARREQLARHAGAYFRIAGLEARP